jgi:3-hydroxyacyl-[acyl-carrier-protein] dehydratase
LRAVDEARSVSDTVIEATKRIVANDQYLGGHYPGFPIYPGVFVLESVRQAVEAARGEGVRLVEVDELRLVHPLLPGDTLCVSATCDPSGGLLAIDARCEDGEGRPIARIRVRLAVGDADG